MTWDPGPHHLEMLFACLSQPCAGLRRHASQHSSFLIPDRAGVLNRGCEAPKQGFKMRRQNNAYFNPFRSYVASEATLVFSPIGPMSPLRRHWFFPVMGFRGFARVRANPFLVCRDNQRTRSCFLL